MVSALFGYETGTRIAHKAWDEGISCEEAAEETGLLPADVAHELFDISTLTKREAMVEMFRKYGKLRHV